MPASRKGPIAHSHCGVVQVAVRHGGEGCGGSGLGGRGGNSLGSLGGDDLHLASWGHAVPRPRQFAVHGRKGCTTAYMSAPC